jgi:hypothetical protein
LHSEYQITLANTYLFTFDYSTQKRLADIFFNSQLDLNKRHWCTAAQIYGQIHYIKNSLINRDMLSRLADFFPVFKREMLVYTQAYLFLYSKLHRICHTGNKYYSCLIQVITIQCISPTVSRKDTGVLNIYI